MESMKNGKDTVRQESRSSNLDATSIDILSLSKDSGSERTLGCKHSVIFILTDFTRRRPINAKASKL